MIGSLLLFLSVALSQLGTSPFAGKDHTHQWVELHIDEEVFSVFDANWTKTVERDGRTLALLLVRSELNDPEGLARLDLVMAVDCASNQFGARSVYLHEPADGLVLDIDISKVDMSLAEQPLSEEDAAYFEVACSSKETK